LTDLDDTTDPFHPNNVAKVQLFVSMRIYDVLLGLLASQGSDGEELSTRLIEVHNSGKVMGPLPWIDLRDEGSDETQASI
jgi:hypothetical protein